MNIMAVLELALVCRCLQFMGRNFQNKKIIFLIDNIALINILYKCAQSCLCRWILLY